MQWISMSSEADKLEQSFAFWEWELQKVCFILVRNNSWQPTRLGIIFRISKDKTRICQVIWTSSDEGTYLCTLGQFLIFFHIDIEYLLFVVTPLSCCYSNDVEVDSFLENTTCLASYTIKRSRKLCHISHSADWPSYNIQIQSVNIHISVFGWLYLWIMHHFVQ